MKKYWMVIIIVILLSSCAPSPEKIEEAIEQTQIAKEKSNTSTPSHTNTPAATNTPEPTNTPTATNTPKTELGTFSNPFPFKRRVGLTMTSEGKEISFEFRIDEVIRGEDAWSIIKQANMFNDPPPDGYEAILIKIYVKNISSAGFLILEFFDLSLATKGNVLDGFFYKPCCFDRAGLVEFEAKLNPSGEHSGWYVNAVHIDENSPMLVLAADRSGRGGIYLSLE